MPDSNDASANPISKSILKQGYIDVKVYVSGLRQSHRLQVVREKTAHGTVPFLVSQYYIPLQELIRLAEQLQLPIKHKDTSVFPRGKALVDFVEDPGVMATVQSTTIEAEIED